MISNIVTDTFGKTSKSILELILSKEDNVSLEEITPLLRKNLKSTPEEILEAVQGNLTHEQNSKMKICLDHYDTLIECIDNIEKAVLPLILPYQNQINLILTVLQVLEIFLQSLYFQKLVQICQFSKMLNIYALGLVLPHSANESAGKKKSVHISRAGVYIKPLLVQCANNAVRDKSCPYFKLRYDAIKSVEVINVQLSLLLECYLLASIKCFLKRTF